MSVPLPHLRSRLAAGERLVGVLLRMPSEDLLEMAGVAGFDFVVIDCEHGPADAGELRRHIVLAQLHQLEVLVRVGSDEPALVLRALDQGAGGIIAPHVDDPETAQALVRAVRYPPHGDRGFATYTRSGQFGTTAAAAHLQAAQELLAIGMIESPAGVSAVDEVLAVPGLDGLLVGLADLGVASGPSDPDPVQSRVEVHAAVARAGVVRLDIVTDPDAAAAAFTDGAHLVVYNTAAALMSHLRSLAAARPR